MQIIYMCCKLGDKQSYKRVGERKISEFTFQSIFRREVGWTAGDRAIELGWILSTAPYLFLLGFGQLSTT